MNPINLGMARMGDRAVKRSGILDLMSRPGGLDEILSRLKGKVKLAEDGHTVVDMDGKPVGRVVRMSSPEPQDAPAYYENYEDTHCQDGPEPDGTSGDGNPGGSPDVAAMLCTGLCYIEDAELIRLLGN